MSQQLINIGNVANDGTGVRLRDAFRIINENFTDLYTTGITNYANVVSFPDATQNIGVTAYSVAEDLMYFSNGASWQPLLTNDSNIVLFGNLVAGNIDATGLVNITGNISATLGTFSNATVTSNATFGNINSVSGILSVTGNANVGNLGTTGLITATANITGGNLITAGILSAGNVTASSNISAGNINSVSGILSVTGNANVGNLGAGAGVFTGTLSVTGNANVGNIGANAAVLAGPLSGVTTINASGNVNVGNIGATNSVITANGTFGNINSVSGILSVSGNANVGNIGAAVGVFTSDIIGQSNLSITSNITAGNINGVSGILSVTGNANVGNIGAGNAVITANATFGNINGVSGILNVSGNANVGNIGATAAVLAGSLSGVTTISASGNANVGNVGATRGVFGSIVGNLETPSQPNITVVGTLTGLTVSGNVIGQSNLAITSNITAGNINGVSGVLNVTGNATADLVITNNIGNGTNYRVGDDIWIGDINITNTMSLRGVQDAANAYVVFGNANNYKLGRAGVGALTYDDAFTVVGNITGQANLFVTSNITAGNINSVSGILSVTGNANLGNVGANNAVFTGTLSVTANANVGNLGTAGLITATGNITGGNVVSNGNLGTSNLLVTNNSNLGNVANIKISGGSPDYVLKTDGAGNLSWVAAGVVSGGTANRLGYYATTGSTITDTGANLTWNGTDTLTVTGTVSAGNLSGNLTTAAQPNITSVGTLGSLTVTGNLSAGNISSGGGLSVTGNANVGNIGATNIVGNITTAFQTNITQLGNLMSLTTGVTDITANTVSTSTTTGALKVAGGVGIVGNLNVGGNVTGATFNNLNLSLGNAAVATNIAVGYQALNVNTTGLQNTAIGRGTLPSVTTGENNTALGYNTGAGIETGDNNTIIGANVTGLGATLSNTIIIADGDGVQRIYVNSDGEVLVGGTTDQGAYNLQCNGTGVWGAGAYVNGSDLRLKTNVNSLDNSLDLIQRLRPVSFNYVPEYNKSQNIHVGFIAQEVKEVLKDQVYVDDVVQQGHEYLGMAYQSLIPLLVKAIQELTEEVNRLKK
jgi:hypothetical protein